VSAEPHISMRVTIRDLELGRRDRLRERLDLASQLRCSEHGQPIVAVTINGRENGWFDAIWTTCCESLERQAVAIVKERC
jgi:hypothetical protein